MALLALEVHDAGVVARRDGAGDGAGGDSPASPGYALVDGSPVVTGEAARARARIRPRQIDSRFWCDLDTKELPRPFPRGLSRADLAHAHLAGLWEEMRAGVDEVLLALPGCHTDRQLGLILGIARACSMPVLGMVDAALAASAGQPGRHLLHLDLQLHRVVVTELTQTNELARRGLRTSPQTGLSALYDAWVKRIADSFVRQMRFDPLHVAETEQGLYDGLPGLLQILGEATRAEVEVEARSTGKRLAVGVSREELVRAVETHYEGIVQLVGLLKRAGRPATILLSHRAEALPGLRERLAADIADARVIPLRPCAATDGVLSHADAIRSDGDSMAFVTRLPVELTLPPVAPGAAVESPTIPIAADRPGPAPTHVLHDGVAHPLRHEAFLLGIAITPGERGIDVTGQTAGISRTHCSLREEDGRVVVEDHSRHGSFLNGQRVEGKAVLVAGDRLRLGSPGIELLLIRVVDEDGAA